MNTNHVMPTYNRLDVSFERGNGIWLWDKAGKRYLDALSGIAVCNLGHSHPAISQAVSEQASKLTHTSNLYRIALQEKLAEKLHSLTGMSQSFFCNSGAEANEAAIKLARLFGHGKGIEKPEILVMENSFHGRTMATLSATGNPAIQTGFTPLLEGFTRIPFGDIQALEAHSANKNIVAVLLEPIQGEGGINVPTDDYLAKVRDCCDQNDWLMMLDEVQTGIGRTGKFLAYQHTEITPDVVSLAKALGNGLPIGACLAAGKAIGILGTGKHGSTFGGNPLACAAALAVLEVLEKDGLVQNAQLQGEKLIEGIRSLSKDSWGISDIRGKGLMIGIQRQSECTSFVSQALKEGILLNVTRGNTVRLLPPLVISDTQINQLAEKLATLFSAASA